MTFTYFLVGLILAYVIYYAVIVSYDLNKAKKLRVDGSEEYTAIDIDQDEFAPKNAEEVYETSEPAEEAVTQSSHSTEEYEPIEESNPEENKAEEASSTEEAQPAINDTKLQAVSAATEEESVIKYNSSLTNHGGLGVTAMKDLIKQASGEENMFMEVTNLFK